MTRTRTLITLLVGIAASAAIAACGVSPTGPGRLSVDNVRAGAQTSAALPGGLLSPLLTPVTVAMRTVPLAQDISVSTVVTSGGGGELSIPAAGLQVIIPPGAVSSTMTITVTALAGSLVAYNFGPSGTQFSTPLQFTQYTNGTDISLLGVASGNVQAAYFENDSQMNDSNHTAMVNELMPLNLGAPPGTVQFSIPHFSGYLIASGNSVGVGSDSVGGGLQTDALRRIKSGGGWR